MKWKDRKYVIEKKYTLFASRKKARNTKNNI